MSLTFQIIMLKTFHCSKRESVNPEASPMPPAPLLWPFGLLFVGYFFTNFSAQMCVLVRWCLDAVSTSRVFQFTVNWGADVVKFGAQNVSVCMLVASNLAPWGPSSDPGGLGSTRKETSGLKLHDFRWLSRGARS